MNVSHFVRQFDKGRHHARWDWNLFRNWIGSVCGFMTNDIEKLKSHADQYSADTGRFFFDMMQLYIELAEQHQFCDVLGSIYQEMREHNKWAGQYFTPDHLCQMMAAMQFDEAQFREKAERHEKVKVADPCCGSGAMFLAFGKVVYEKLDTWGLNHVEFYGQDIDGCCVDMCRIQLRINGLDRFGRMMRLCSAMDSVLETPTSGLTVPSAPLDAPAYTERRPLPCWRARTDS